MGRERGAWLIKDENAGLLGDGLDDFSQLALASAQASGLCQGININIETLKQFSGAVCSSFVVDQSGACLHFVGQKYVLGHSQGGDQTHFLKNHGYACAR